MNIMYILLSLFIVGTVLLVMIAMLFENVENLFIARLKIAIAPFSFVTLVIAIYLTPQWGIVLAYLAIFAFLCIGVREGIVHYYLVKKGYPLKKGSNWKLISINRARELPPVSNEREGHIILSSEIDSYQLDA